MKDYSKIGDKLVMQRPRRRLEGTAMGATVFDLRPGVGIGPFSIGNCDSLKYHNFCYFSLVSRIREGVSSTLRLSDLEDCKSICDRRLRVVLGIL